MDGGGYVSDRDAPGRDGSGAPETPGSGVGTRRRISLREVRALGPGETVWDGQVMGFCARRQRGAAVSYVLFYRCNSRRRMHTIGKHLSPWTPETARAEAQRLLGEIVRGADPAAAKKARRTASSITLGALCDEYLADAEAGRLLTRRRAPKTATTLATDRSRIEAHIKPLLGAVPVTALDRADVERLLHGVAAGKTCRRIKLNKPRALSNVTGGIGAASRTIGLLGAILGYAVQRGLREDNPVRGIIRPADGRRERRLRVEEYAALGRALVAAEALGVWPPGLAALRFLLLTGWRSGEALGLRWAEIDLDRRTARLAETKTGISMRPLSAAACQVLRGMPRSSGSSSGSGGAVVFPAPSGDLPMGGFRRVWTRVAHRLAGLPFDVTPHVLRHSFASLAADLGHGDATIAGLLGHRGHTVTRRYVHSADTALLAAADKVAEETARLMHPANDPARATP
ncbi:MAG: site-specific integrase [Acetobacteraceae bacterium]|nr:site-specific integrase [Acetobacteraceae bacterium]